MNRCPVTDRLTNTSSWNQSDVGKRQRRTRQRGTMNKTETIDEYIQQFPGYINGYGYY